MFFSAYIGSADNAVLWEDITHRHASWLGLIPYLESRRLDDNRNFCFGWLRHKERPLAAQPPLETQELLLINASDTTVHDKHATLPIQLWQRPGESVNVNVIHAIYSLKDGELRVVVPPSTPEPFYFAKWRQGFVFGNDIRLLLRFTGLDLDEHAIYALFLYGAIPPTITISKNVQRVPNGHVLKVIPKSDEIILESYFQPVKETWIKDPHPEVQVRDILDKSLATVPFSTAMYFSGGVDSGLLAARLSEMGRTDIRLINYSFGPHDQDGHLALRMAAHLGLACEQVMYDPSAIPLVLERLGRDYSFPFGDASVIPHNLLVHASLRSHDRPLTIINGTGADAAFKTIVKPIWNRVYCTPKFIRQIIAKGYEWLKYWQYDSKIEYHARLYRQSLQTPFQRANIIANDPLDGIAYAVPSIVHAKLQEAIESRIQALVGGLELDKQLRFLDQVLKCACRHAANSFDPLRRLGIQSLYPFLEPPMIHLSLSLQRDENDRGVDKALLKRLLVSRVPEELVYRPKRHFFPPLQEILTYSSVQEILRNVTLSRGNPLIDFYRIDTVKQMVERAREPQSLGKVACQFLWVLTFTSAWLSQLEFQ